MPRDAPVTIHVSVSNSAGFLLRSHQSYPDGVGWASTEIRVVRHARRTDE